MFYKFLNICGYNQIIDDIIEEEEKFEKFEKFENITIKNILFHLNENYYEKTMHFDYLIIDNIAFKQKRSKQLNYLDNHVKNFLVMKNIINFDKFTIIKDDSINDEEIKKINIILKKGKKEIIKSIETIETDYIENIEIKYSFTKLNDLYNNFTSKDINEKYISLNLKCELYHDEKETQEIFNNITNVNILFLKFKLKKLVRDSYLLKK